MIPLALTWPDACVCVAGMFFGLIFLGVISVLWDGRSRR